MNWKRNLANWLFGSLWGVMVCCTYLYFGWSWYYYLIAPLVGFVWYYFINTDVLWED